MLQGMFERLFGKKTVPRGAASELASAVPCEERPSQPTESAAPVLGPEALLESSFFSWLLSCEQDALAFPSSSLRDKEQALLAFIDSNLFDVDKLPRQPASLPMLIKLLNDENSSNAQISKALLSDPALTAQILITANSPFFSRNPEPVKSIDQAVLSLGRIGIRNIVSASIMMPMMKNRNGQDSDLTRRIWEWGVASATACDQYAIEEGREAGLFYLLGLLLPLSYLLIHNALEGYAEANSEVELEECLVKKLLLTKSWELCAELCEQWNLPVNTECGSTRDRESVVSILKDSLQSGVFLSAHALLLNQEGSPLNNDELGCLTKKSPELDKQILKKIEQGTVV